MAKIAAIRSRSRAAGHFGMSGDGLIKLLLDRVDGIETVHGVLRDERDIAPADTAQLRRRDARSSSRPANSDPADVTRPLAAGCREWPWRSSTCRSRIRRRVRDSRPPRVRQRDAIDRHRLALRRAVGDTQVSISEQRHYQRPQLRIEAVLEGARDHEDRDHEDRQRQARRQHPPPRARASRPHGRRRSA